MKFYTLFQVYHGKLYVQGYENGMRFRDIQNHTPFLFIPSKNPAGAKYRTLDGKPVDRIDFASNQEELTFKDKYSGIEGFEFYGMTGTLGAYSRINELFAGDIEYDPSLIRALNFDIETSKIGDDGSTGFPDINAADKPITSITITCHGKTYTLGYKDFDNSKGQTEYIKCSNEENLLYKFVDIWSTIDPDVVTGWNCLPLNSSVWFENEIKKLHEVKVDDTLYDSTVKNVSPISRKKIFKQKLANGYVVSSSEDHKFPYKLCDGEKYTKLIGGNKCLSRDEEMTVGESLNQSDERFIYVKLRKNINDDFSKLTDEQSHLLGLIYTDGSIKNKLRIQDGFSLYQSDYEMLLRIKHRFNLDTKIIGPYKGCYKLHIPYSTIGEFHSFIYEGVKKKLCINMLSKLSEKQYYNFLSGMLDGDGTNSHGKLALCNFNGDIETIYELSLWNGIFSTITKDTIRFIDIKLDKLNLIKHKRWDNFEEKSINRKSSQKAKQIRFKKDGDGYWVRVRNVSMGEEVDMMDIETDTHYFISGGTLTHNCEYFDIPYTYNRICKLLGKQVGEKLSPFKKILRNDAEIHGRMINMVEILGVVTLDYMKIYKKFSFTNQESYSLNHISHVELNEKKLDYSDYEDLQDLYDKNYQLFIEYNIKDVWLVERLEEKLGLLQQIYAMTYDAKVNYIDTLATVRIWDVIIHNHLMKKNIVIPDMKFAKPGHTIIGGHVKEVIPGMYKWVVSVDLDSLYPHLIMQYNISPETFVDQIEEFKRICFGTFDYESKKYQIEPNGERCVDLIFDDYIDENKMKILKNQNVAFSGSGCLYNRSAQGFLPYLMETMYNDRKAYKKKMLKAEQELEAIKKNKAKYNNYDELVKLKTAEIARNHNMQQAKKIQLNSVYGALSNKYFRWYDIQLAESITASGQLSIRFIANSLNKYLNNLLKSDGKDYVIAIDTDSVYLNMEDLVARLMPDRSTEDIVNFLDTVCDKKITPFINSQYKILADSMNAYQQKMNMSREVIADKGVWTAKKRYILNVWDKEGTRYNEAKHKMMGIEAVRSSTPEVVRNYIKDAIYILMNEDEDAMTSFISKCRDEFKKLAFEDVASPRTCNNLKKYTGKDGITFAPKIPIQVRGAGIYNHLLKEKGLDTKYELINEGDKIKYCYLKTPNPTKSNVVSVPGVLPRELGLENYIDYNEQFDKNFIAPIKKILDAIDWPVEKRLTLDEFFT